MEGKLTWCLKLYQSQKWRTLLLISCKILLFKEKMQGNPINHVGDKAQKENVFAEYIQIPKLPRGIYTNKSSVWQVCSLLPLSVHSLWPGTFHTLLVDDSPENLDQTAASGLTTIPQEPCQLLGWAHFPRELGFQENLKMEWTLEGQVWPFLPFPFPLRSWFPES